jgi:benzil reductase ((S)-benzoin forming)
MTRTAVVTGASRGLGAALATELSRRGYGLAICATTTPTLEGAFCRAVDVADDEAMQRFARDASAALGPIDLWINNAAILGPIGPLRTSDADSWRRCVDVNLVGIANGIRAFLAHRRPGGGSLVNIASRVATTPSPGLSAYTATKAAVVAVTKCVAEEERGSGLRAIVVLPPSIDTDMQNTLLAQDEASFPDVEASLRRKREGGVVPAILEAVVIVDAVLRDDHAPVVDLTTFAVKPSS